MFAVIKTGGKQYTVKVGDVFNVEKVEAELAKEHLFSDVLLISDGKSSTIGSPFIKGATVTVEIVSHARGDKVLVFKKKRRKDYRKRQGHRQLYTRVKVTNINAAK